MNELLTHLFKRMEILEGDVRKCNEKHLEATQFQNGALVRTIEKNTQTLERIEKLLKTNKA